VNAHQRRVARRRRERFGKALPRYHAQMLRLNLEVYRQLINESVESVLEDFASAGMKWR
jgi:hypothetical protein